MISEAKSVGHEGSSALRAVARLFCLIPLATGLGDIAQGAGFLATAGAELPPGTLADPVLNSQLMFAGAIWLGYAPLIWYATGDLSRRAALFRLLFGLIFLSGIARVLAMIRYGSPGAILTGATAVELLLPPVLILWSLRAAPSTPRRQG